MGRIRREYVDGSFGQIHVRIAKPKQPTSAPPLYCLHQSPKSSLEFEGFMEAASIDREVIAFDYPKYGMSDGPDREEDISIKAYAQAGWQVVKALGHKTIDLFGNHTGGKVAVEMTTMRPQRVNAIAMVSAAILTAEERASFENMFTPIPLDEKGTRFQTNWARIVERKADSEGLTLEMMERSFYMTMMAGEAYEWGHTVAFAYDKEFNERISKIQQRITVLNPDDDLQHCTPRVAKLLRNGEVVETPHWSHNFLMSDPKGVASLIRAKLDA